MKSDSGGGAISYTGWAWGPQGPGGAARSDSLGIGDAWVFPSPRWPDRVLSRNMLDRWLKEAQKRARLEPLGWHSLRRKFASELKDIPLVDLCALGGWKDPKTILTCYQMPDQDLMRQSLAARKPLGKSPQIRQSIRQS